MSAAQNIDSQDIYWSKTSMMSALSNIGGSAVTVIALVSCIISNYQKFAYDREALNQLFYETKNEPSDGDSDEDGDDRLDRENSR